MSNTYSFPFGIYCGELIDKDSNSIPLLIPEESGGVCVIFDDDKEQEANIFIENMALKLLEIVSIGKLEINIFDYSIRKRFSFLSSFKSNGLYKILNKSQLSNQQFSELEDIAFKRHDELLSNQNRTISIYNQNSKFPEIYYLIIINLKDFPDDLTSDKRFMELISAAQEAGIYIIAFGNKDILSTKKKATKFILNQYPIIEIDENIVLKPHKKVIPLLDVIAKYKCEIELINEDRDEITKNILEKLQQDGNDNEEKEFLSIPIGTSANGRVEMYFSLGDRSRNYHAFIMGMPGTGKSTLLSNIILGVAQNYTKDEVELYLMDFKEGTEFNLFVKHPNCRKIFLENKDTQAAFELLQKFNGIIEDRGTLFKQKRVKDISEYNTLDDVKTLPRILLIVDEAQRLFTGSYTEQDRLNQLLEDVARRGRSFGIHMILSTQTLAGTNINKELMSQISLRISYQLNNEQDCDKIFGYGNTAPLKLKRYELIYNANSGLKDLNRLCRAYPPNDIDKMINSIRKERGEENCLTPEIVRSTDNLKEKQPTWSFEPFKNSTKISIEDESLAKLEKEGIVPEDLDKEL